MKKKPLTLVGLASLPLFLTPLTVMACSTTGDKTPTKVNAVLTASQFGFRGSALDNKGKINAQWIVQNKKLIFTGTTDLIQVEKVESTEVIDSGDSDALSVKVVFKPQSIINDKGKPNLIKRQFDFVIQDFASESDPTQKFGNWNDETIGFNSQQFWNDSKLQPEIFNIWSDLENKKDEIARKMSFEIHTIDVGQADSILLKFTPLEASYFQQKAKQNQDWRQTSEYVNNTFNILIDTGNHQAETSDNSIRGTYTPNYESKLKNYLNAKLAGGDKIDMFVLTHADADHIGQAAKVMDDFGKPNQSVVVNFGDANKTTKTLKQMIQTIAKNGFVYVDPLAEKVFNDQLIANVIKNPDKADDLYAPFLTEKYGHWEENNGIKTNFVWNPEKLFKIEPSENLIKFTDYSYFAFLAPTIDYHPGEPNEVNESSINTFLKISNPDGKEFTALFSGDSEGATHQDVMNIMKNNVKFKKSNGDTAVDVYKVAHHGSTTKTSNNAEFLSFVTDEKTRYLISVNTNKLFGGVPTLRETFWKNVDKAVKSEKIDFDNDVLITQNLGDIILKATAGDPNLVIETMDRETQLKTKIWTKSVPTKNPVNVPSQYQQYLYSKKN